MFEIIGRDKNNKIRIKKELEITEKDIIFNNKSILEDTKYEYELYKLQTIIL